MLRLEKASEQIVPKVAFRLDAETFGSTQQTPLYYDQHLFGVRPDGQFVCLDPGGKIVWQSGPNQTFGLGSYLLAGGLLYALNDSGSLLLGEITSSGFTRLGQAQVLHGRESWAPMALAGTRLIVRDLTQMVCLEIGSH
jgi:outer membrane protein assembly factor BamB